MDMNLEDALDALRQEYNKNVWTPLERKRSTPPPARFDKNNRRRRSAQLPEMPTSDFARIILRQYRHTETFLKGIHELPEDDQATGAVAIVRVVQFASKDSGSEQNSGVKEVGFIVSADWDKQYWHDRGRRTLEKPLRWGFPGGGIDPSRDGNIADTLFNEIYEETGIHGKHYHWQYLDAIPLARESSVKRHLFATEAPASIRIRKGHEQFQLTIMTRAEINAKINVTEQGRVDHEESFLPNSINYWRAYQRAMLRERLHAMRQTNPAE